MASIDSGGDGGHKKGPGVNRALFLCLASVQTFSFGAIINPFGLTGKCLLAQAENFPAAPG